MTHSSTFRRTLILTYGVVLGFALMILGIWNATSPRIFAQNKIDDLIPKGQIIASYIESTLNGEISSSYLMPLIGRSTSQWEATVWVVDSQGNTLIRTQMIDGRRVGSLPSRLSSSMLPKVLKGETAVHIGTMDDLADSSDTTQASSDTTLLGQLTGSTASSENEEVISGGVVAVAVPISYADSVVGAVFMAQSMTEVMSGMQALSNTTLISLLSVALMLLPVVLFFTTLMCRPLIEMRRVALIMAGGDFNIRARDQRRDEYGELGRALNRLTAELGSTISNLQLERNRLSSLVNGISEGIISLNRGEEKPFVNPAVRTLLGLSADCADYRSAAPEIFTTLDSVLESGEPAQQTFWRGKTALHLSVSPLTAKDGSVSGCVAILSDVTSAERLEQTRRDYVANVSHELRTPLTALRGLIEPLRDGLVKDEDQKQQIYDVVLRETMRLSRLVNDMLELSRLQSGTISLQRSVFSPLSLLNTIRDTYSAYAEDCQQTFVYDVPEQLPDVFGNADRTQQVLVALLDNAFKYTPEGGTVTLSAALESDLIRISVRDTGIGIGEEDLPHVFDRFYKADKSHHSRGTGLGLAIAYEIMKQLGEDLTVTSRLGEGSTFSLTLHPAKATDGLPESPDNPALPN